MMKKLIEEKTARNIQTAFVEWSAQQPKKTVFLTEIGTSSGTNSWSWIQGKRTPPPAVLAKLYAKTGDSRFLLSRKEKEAYRRKNLRDGPILDLPEWPDRDQEEDYRADIMSVRQKIEELRKEIERLATLPANSGRRKEAKKQLVTVTMQLFRDLTALNLEFPEAFLDLLQQLDLAAQTFGKGGNHEKD